MANRETHTPKKRKRRFASRAEQRAARKKTEAMLAETARQAISDAFNRAVPLAVDIGPPRTSGDFCRWFNTAFRREIEFRETAR